jgi:hypothetical protein
MLLSKAELHSRKALVEGAGLSQPLGLETLEDPSSTVAAVGVSPTWMKHAVESKKRGSMTEVS